MLELLTQIDRRDAYLRRSLPTPKAKPLTENSPEWDKCGIDAAYFTDEYVQIDEPQGGDLTVVPFKLWPAQAESLGRLVAERLLIILKARQLGITWLCCAYALWLCMFKRGQVVLLFSKGALEAYELARRIRVMYLRLPLWMRHRNPLVKDNFSEMAWANGSRIQSLAATRTAGRSFTASLVLMDEAAFMQWATELYTALKPTIDGGGQLFVVSTANGEQGLFHKLWAGATESLNNFATLFLSWRARPERDEAWRARVAAEALSSAVDLQEYPGTAEEAFQATSVDRFLSDIALWDVCREELPPLDGNTPCVLAMDAGESNDTFATVIVSRHPARPNVVAVRYARAYVPVGGQPLDFDAIEQDIRNLCKEHAVTELTYDPMLLGQMIRRLKEKPVTVYTPFPQGAQRLEADKQLLDAILQRQITHDGNAQLREHLDNADKKVDDEGRRLRIVKREYAKKIDLAVALSMATKRADLILPEIEEPEESYGYQGNWG